MRKPTADGVYKWLAAGFTALAAYMLTLDSYTDIDWFFVLNGLFAHVAAGLTALSTAKPTPSTPEPEKPVQRTDGPLFDDIDYEPVRNNYTFSQRSLENLGTCHPDLQKVAKRALQLTKWDFAVICGKRSVEEQRSLVDTGKSLTMKSRHILTPSHAFDIMVYGPDGGTWEVMPYYRDVTNAMKEAAKELNIPIVCGIDWSNFVDASHIELDKSVYPDPVDLVLA